MTAATGFDLAMKRALAVIPGRQIGPQFDCARAVRAALKTDEPFFAGESTGAVRASSQRQRSCASSPTASSDS